MKLEMLVSEKLGKAISESSNQEIYQALMAVVQDMAEQKESNAGKKKVYYVIFQYREISQSEEVLRVIFNCAQRVYHDIIL